MADYLQPPDIVLEWSSDPLSDTTPAWTAVDPGEIRHLEWWAGVDREGADPEPGGMTVVLKNVGRKWEPYYNTNLIDTQQRFRLTLDGFEKGVWYTSEFAISYPTGQEYSEVTVTCGDGCEVLALDDLPGLDPPDAQSYEDVVQSDEPWGYWRLGEQAGTRAVPQFRRSRHNVAMGKRRRRLTVRRRVGTRYFTSAEAGGVSGPSGVYKGLPTLGRPGLIVGDSDTSAVFAGTNQRVRVTLQDTEELSGGHCSVEGWFTFTDAGSPLGTIFLGPNNATLGSRIFRLEVEDLGSPQLTWAGFTTTGGLGWDISTPVTAGTLYYGCGTYDGNTARLYLDGQQVASAGVAGGGVVAPSALEASIGDNVDTVFNLDEVAVYEHALTAERVLAHFTAGAERGYEEDVAGNRIRDILDDIPLWSVGAVMNTGRNIQPVMKAGQPRLEEIAESMHAEGPTTLFWFDGGGDPRYLGHEWQTIADAYHEVQHVFSDAGDGIPYLDAEFVIDSETFNEVTASREGGPEIVASDAVAQATRGRRAHTEYTDTLLTEDILVESLANHVLDLYKTPARRPVTLTVDGSHALAQIQTVQPGILIEVRKLGDDQVASRRVTHVLGKRETLTADRQLICTWSLARGFDPDDGVWRAGIVGYSEAGSTTVAA